MLRELLDAHKEVAGPTRERPRQRATAVRRSRVGRAAYCITGSGTALKLGAYFPSSEELIPTLDALRHAARSWELSIAERGQFTEALEAVKRDAALYSGLPRQLIHADYDPSNVLFQGSRVSAVLDFEFASLGPRIADVAVAVGSFARSPREGCISTSAASALIDGYFRGGGRIGDAELDVLPTLRVVRETGSLLHSSKKGSRNLVARCRRLLAVSDWAQFEGPQFVATIKATGTQ